MSDPTDTPTDTGAPEPDPTAGQEGQAETPGNQDPGSQDSPTMAMLMESMEAAIGGIAHTQQEAANQVPLIREQHQKLEADLAKAYQGEDFKRYYELVDEIEALERVWTTTLQTVGPDPESFGLPAHPTLVDPDN